MRHSGRLLTVFLSVGVLVLAGCGGSDKSGSSGPGGAPLPKIAKLASLGTGEGEVNIVAWAGYDLYRLRQPEDPTELFRKYVRGMEVPTKLDEAFVDGDGDLVADVPKDAKEHLDPDTLVFQVLGADEEKEQERWQDFVLHLAKETGKKVVVTNQFGEQVLTVGGTVTLCVPSIKKVL